MSTAQDNRDNRRREYFQSYHSETKTLARCYDVSRGNPYVSDTSIATWVKARIRVIKEDRRLPLFIVIAFEPEGGNPDDASLTTKNIPTITVAEMILCNRSLVPVVRVAGNRSIGGPLDFPHRKGTLGIAIEVGSDVDAVDCEVTLYQALGGDKSPYIRYGGKWSVGYSFTCADRLSREEWDNVVNKTVMQVDISSDASDSNCTPSLIGSQGGQ